MYLSDAVTDFLSKTDWRGIPYATPMPSSKNEGSPFTPKIDITKVTPTMPVDKSNIGWIVAGVVAVGVMVYLNWGK